MVDLSKLPPEDLARLAYEFGRGLQQTLDNLRTSGEDREDLRQFMAFAIPLTTRSKAQLFQDLWALWVSDRKTGGYFVEFGAADGLSHSNTYLLETEMGWTGLLAEPNPAFFASLGANRRCAVSHLCVHPVGDRPVEFLAAREGELSRLEEISPADRHEASRLKGATRLTVDTITLNDLLVRHQSPRRIDYMSVDTEGSEHAILSSFDFDRWDVRAISVEHNYTPERARLHDLLTGVGYRRQWPELSLFDDWYVRI